MLRYPCLVLDHDDTVVKSTPEIHYPAFLKTLATLRPGRLMTLEAFVGYCFDPGFHALCMDILGFSEEEMRIELDIWRDYTSGKIPDAYEGIRELIVRQKKAGGSICVVSHSEADVIARDYKKHIGVVPDMIFGWELDEEQRKPKPYPLMEIMRKLDVPPSGMLMVDDLKPGLDMAHSCSVAFAWAGWSGCVPAIEAYMHGHADFCFQTVRDLSVFLFGTDRI